MPALMDENPEEEEEVSASFYGAEEKRVNSYTRRQGYVGSVESVLG